MEFVQLLDDLKAGRISRAEAANSLKLTEKELTRRIAIHGSGLRKLFEVFDRIQTDGITRKEASALLGVNAREVNYLMTSWGVRRAVKPYRIEQELITLKWELHTWSSLRYLADECSLKDVAELRKIEERSMRRWIAKLLKKHLGMVYKDWKGADTWGRRSIANEIMEAEGITAAKRRVLEAISRGGNEILEQEAWNRLKEKGLSDDVRRRPNKKDR